MDITLGQKVDRAFSFPTADVEMARIRFEVELSSAGNILWEETQRGLLSFFAMCSHAVYLELAEALKEKCGDSFQGEH